jgi:hypothetical protein
MLGEICSSIGRIPTSVVILKELEKCGTIAFASGGFTDIWQAEHKRQQVAMKKFRMYSDENMTEAKKVRFERV